MRSVKELKEDMEKLKFVVEHSSSKSLKNYFNGGTRNEESNKNFNHQ